jgi:hypothetical protein
MDAILIWNRFVEGLALIDCPCKSCDPDLLVPTILPRLVMAKVLQKPVEAVSKSTRQA